MSQNNVQGLTTALSNAQGLQTRIFQKFGELKRPVISKAKSAQDVEDEDRGLKAMQEKLNTLEKKLRVFRDLDSSKAEERANVMTSLDGARRDLLAAAREFEAYSFGSKDIIQSIMDFCQLKQAQANASPRSFKGSFKSGAPSSRRDDQPQQHADQNERPSARRYSAGSNASGLGLGTNQSTPSVSVAPLPSHLSSSASKRYPSPPEKEQAQPAQAKPSQPAQPAQPLQAALSSRLPRAPAAAGNSNNNGSSSNDNGNSNNNNSINKSSNSSSGISVAATAAAFSGPSGAVAPASARQRPTPGSLNIRVPYGHARNAQAGSDANSTTSSASANSANNYTVRAGNSNAHGAAVTNNIRTSNNSSSGESASPATTVAAAAGDATSSTRGSGSSLSRASSLPRAPGLAGTTTAAAQPPLPPSQQAAPAAAAASKLPPPSTPPAAAAGGQPSPVSSRLARVEGPPLLDHSPQMTQDSSMCNMESVCGAGTYPGGHSATPTDPSATGVGNEPSARLKALAQLHGQDTASSIPAPPPTAPQRPRMLDAYMAAVSSSSSSPPKQQQQDLLHDHRGSELTLGHVIAKPSAIAATGSLRPTHSQRANTAANDAASSSSSTRSATPSAASSLSLPATHATAAAALPQQAATPGMHGKDTSEPPTAAPPAAEAPVAKAGNVTTAVTLKPAPRVPQDRHHQLTHEGEEVEGSSTTPHRTATHPSALAAQGGTADARMLSPALSSTHSSSDSPPNNMQGAGRSGAAGDKRKHEGSPPGVVIQEAEQEEPGIVVAGSSPLSPDECKALEFSGKRAEASAAAVMAAKQSTDSVGSAAAPGTPAAQPPGSSHVAKLQQRFLQTPSQQHTKQQQQCEPATPSVLGMLRNSNNQQQQREPATPCTDSVLGVLRNGSQQQKQQSSWESRGNSEGFKNESGVQGTRKETKTEGTEGGEGSWEAEAQRTTARAPPPRAQLNADLDRSSGIAAHMHPAHTMHLQTPSSRMAPPATAANRQLAPQHGHRGGDAATPADMNLAPPAHHQFNLPQYDGRATAADAVPAEQQLLLQQQYRAAAAAAAAANHGQSGVGSKAGASGPPPSVLAAGPQLVAAGLVSVPPAFASRPAMRACEAWETEGEEDEVVQEQQALLQMQAMEALLHQQHATHMGSIGSGGLDATTYSRRHTAPDPALMERLQQQLRVCAPCSMHGALSTGPSTPSPAPQRYVGGGGRRRQRGVWRGILRVLGITTTVASVVVATGAAVFAAAALNTGLDELDLMHPEASTPISNGSRGPFKSKVQRAKCPQGSSMRHPDALAAGRG